MFRKLVIHIIFIGLSLGLSACGKTGELYLPDDKAETPSKSSQ